MVIALMLALAATSLMDDCTVAGKVIDVGTSQPVYRAQIVVDTQTDLGSSSDAEGNFRISLPGSCDKAPLVISKSGFISQRIARNVSQPIEIRLERESRFSGVVLDTEGQPIADATIDLALAFETPIPPQTVIVSPSGEYTTSNMPPGSYRLCAHSSASVYPVGGGHKLVYIDRCVNTKLDAGERQRLDFTLSAVPSVHVSGTAVGAPDGIVPSISLYRDDSISNSPVGVKPAVGGAFEFGDVVPGQYMLQASAVDGPKPFFGSQELTVGSGGVSNLSLTLLPGIDVIGSVRINSTTGSRTPRVRIDLQPQTGSIEWNDTGDLFTISNVLQRKYHLNVMPLASDGAPGVSDFYVQSVRIDNQEALGREFSVMSGMGPIEIVLGDDLATVNITVTDPDGNPTQSYVRLEGDNGGMQLPTDSNGRVASRKLPPGHYIAYAADSPTLRPSEGATSVDLPPSGTVNISLKTNSH